MTPIRFTKAYGEHIKLIKPADVQSSEYIGLLTPEAAAIIENNLSFSAWRGGVCLGAGGVAKAWPTRGEAWLLLGADARPYMRPILRFLRTALDNHPCKRIEMTVLKGNATGHKFADLLGFEEEAVLEAYHPNGDDVVMYKRIRKWQPS